MFRIQDKGSRIVTEMKTSYIEKIEQYLNNEAIFQKDQANMSEDNNLRIKEWCNKFAVSGAITDRERDWISKKDTKAATIYGNVKVHKDGDPLRYIISSIGTAIENLGQWVEYHLAPLARMHPAYLKDTQHFLRYIEDKNIQLQITPDTRMVTRDIVNYYPSCNLDKCIDSVRNALGSRDVEEPPAECIIEALKLTMTSNQCEFMGQFFTQIDGATIGGKDSGSVTDIFGAHIIDTKIQDYCPWSTEHYMRYRDDTFELSEYNEEIEKEKTTWMNDNIYRNIKFEGKSSKDKIEFLDTEIAIEKDQHGEYKLITDMYAKKTDTHQYLSPKSCHPRVNTQSIPYSVIHRIRRNCSDRAVNDNKFRNQAVMYKAFLMKSGHKESDIDNQFVKILTRKRENLLVERSTNRKKKKRKHQIRFITDYEPKFPSIRNALKELEPKIRGDALLQKMFPAGVKDIQISERRGGKNIKEILAKSKINALEERSGIGYQSECGKVWRGVECVDCQFLRETSGNSFASTVTGRTHYIRQIVSCISWWIVYLVTCKKCNIQGVGSAKECKKRLANYRSVINNKKNASCGIEHHFCQEDHNIHDFSFQIIAKLEKEPKNKNQMAGAYRRLRTFEGHWQIQLSTIEPHGMNTIDEYHRNKYSYDKPAFQ